MATQRNGSSIVSVVEDLIERYERFVRIPWSLTVAGPERVWMLVYPPRDERRLRARITELEIATKQADHEWDLVDLTDEFAEWMTGQEYRESYFERPGDMSMALQTFGQHLKTNLARHLDESNANTVTAVMGLGSLFSLYSVSELIDSVSHRITGRLLALFPGVREGNNYRLLDAKDGWSYLAIPIDLSEDMP